MAKYGKILKVKVFDWKEDKSAKNFIKKYQQKKLNVYDAGEGIDAFVVVVATKGIITNKEKQRYIHQTWSLKKYNKIK